MPPSSSFVEHAVDLLSGTGPVKARAMFGGYGLSLEGISIGIIDNDRLYLRVDDETRGAFARAGSEAFVYPSRNGPMTMKNYWSLPEEAVDDPEKATLWGRLALEAARRSEAKKKAGGKKGSAVKKKAKTGENTPKAKPAVAKKSVGTAKKPAARGRTRAP